MDRGKRTLSVSIEANEPYSAQLAKTPKTPHAPYDGLGQPVEEQVVNFADFQAMAAMQQQYAMEDMAMMEQLHTTTTGSNMLSQANDYSQHLSATRSNMTCACSNCRSKISGGVSEPADEASMQMVAPEPINPLMQPVGATIDLLNPRPGARASPGMPSQMTLNTFAAPAYHSPSNPYGADLSLTGGQAQFSGNYY